MSLGHFCLRLLFLLLDLNVSYCLFSICLIYSLFFLLCFLPSFRLDAYYVSILVFYFLLATPFCLVFAVYFTVYSIFKKIHHSPPSNNIIVLSIDIPTTCTRELYTFSPSLVCHCFTTRYVVYPIIHCYYLCF